MTGAATNAGRPAPAAPGAAGGRAAIAPWARPARRAAGFTLIEMLVVLGIVAVLATAALPLQALVQRRAQEQALREALRSVRGALDAHRAAVEARRIAPGPGGTPWPASLQVLVQGVPLIDALGQVPEGAPRLYLLRKLPRDPMADPALGAEDSWDLRASDSPPDRPAPGRDVFDLRSRSDRQALDGSRYRDW